MKTKLLTIITVLSFAGRSLAQPIPNAGFEDWTNFGTYSDPTSWTSLNSLFIGLLVTCEKGTPGAVGNSYLKLTVKSGLAGSMGGYAISHAPPFQFDLPEPGFAINSRPERLTGKYQHLTTGNDVSQIFVCLTKWNPSTSLRDTVALGAHIITAGAITSWTNFSVPLYYFNGMTPDSAVIILGAGVVDEPVVNDYLYIDDLAFTGTVSGIPEVQDALKMTVAPNPFSTQTIISFREEQKNATVILMDGLGRQLSTSNFSGDHFTIERGEMNAGIYFVRVIDENKNVMNRKIVVQ